VTRYDSCLRYTIYEKVIYGFDVQETYIDFRLVNIDHFLQKLAPLVKVLNSAKYRTDHSTMKVGIPTRLPAKIHTRKQDRAVGQTMSSG
jgi:hypothetical protein